MTINVTMECDAFNCHNELEVSTDDVNDPTCRTSWECDPNDPWTHYCGKCWPEVKKEFEEEA